MVYWHAISTTKKVQLETVANLILETVIFCSNIYIYIYIYIYICIYQICRITYRVYAQCGRLSGKVSSQEGIRSQEGINSQCGRLSGL